MAKGIVYLVGAGPGEPGLITGRGLECIRRADLLAYDRLVSPALVAQARPGAELVYVGKESGQHGRRQSDINGLLADRALAGQVVCRLKGGDPFVFGRGGEEAEFLAALGVRHEVVPGVTSGLAAAAYAGIPVTHRDLAGSVTLVTGHDARGKGGLDVDWDRLATGSETLLIYMGVEALPEITGRLIEAGRASETPAAVIHWGSRAEQRVVTGTLVSIAGEARRAGIRSPAMTVVGDVVSLRERIGWVEKKPLFGQRVLIPMVTTVAPDSAWSLREAGAEVWEWPVGWAVSPQVWHSRLDTAPLLTDSLRNGEVAAVFLPSPEVVPLFLECIGGPQGLGDLPLFCSDLPTAQAASAAGFRVSGTAEGEALIPLVAEGNCVFPAVR